MYRLNALIITTFVKISKLKISLNDMKKHLLFIYLSIQLQPPYGAALRMLSNTPDRDKQRNIPFKKHFEFLLSLICAF